VAIRNSKIPCGARENKSDLHFQIERLDPEIDIEDPRFGHDIDERVLLHIFGATRTIAGVSQVSVLILSANL